MSAMGAYEIQTYSFVSKMTVTNVSLWIDSEQPHIAMDFMIAPDESDEIQGFVSAYLNCASNGQCMGCTALLMHRCYNSNVMSLSQMACKGSQSICCNTVIV